ncbi:PREDICTED: D-cysteine desulfhydrase 2, mitochondrial isoform X2 [Nelumbo nucifera]|uniref:D-cysteine desulfhydrase 2, mitochondrial isoform X2 n=1 Tax=Nelumbo nucifera TaxID=4432 RepID=A0A1U7ZHF0_NELNU|nr:PREDICTED: D-cysteine desulfhydrase 2, mitochondrial isoform X2 [Nelumbo nucifera]
MKLQQLPRSPAAMAMKNGLLVRAFSNSSMGTPKLKQCGKAFISDLLDRRWALLSPDTKIHQIRLSGIQIQHGAEPFVNFSFSNNTAPPLVDDSMEKNDQDPFFYVLRDDLLHPLVNGNKARKLDTLLPLVEDHSVTDVVTCGGCQSAHAAAVAVSCAERGLRSHLLLRGEQPEVVTGYNLISTMYGDTTYIPRHLYTKREEMLKGHADLVAGSSGSVVWLSDILKTSLVSCSSEEGSFVQANAFQRNFTLLEPEKRPRKVVIVNEGAGDAIALLGIIRLVEYLSQTHLFGRDQPMKFIVDAGTGTTAIGLGLGAICLGLPWEVIAVMLADTIEGYRKQEKRLISEFKMLCSVHLVDHPLNEVDGGIVNWVERSHPRNVFFQIRQCLEGRSRGVQKNCQANWYFSGSHLHLGRLGTCITPLSGGNQRGCQSGNASHWGYTWHVWIGTKIQILLPET